MTITQNTDRQCPLVATVAFDFSMFGATGVAEAAVDVPAGARVTGGRLVIDVVFDSGTTDAIEVGDGGSVARYLATQDVRTAVGEWPLVPTGYSYTAADTV